MYFELEPILGAHHGYTHTSVSDGDAGHYAAPEHRHHDGDDQPQVVDGRLHQRLVSRLRLQVVMKN